MDTKVQNKPLIKALSGYSARQLQFAIRLGLLPTPDKLRRILSKKSGSESDAELLIKSLSDMKS